MSRSVVPVRPAVLSVACLVAVANAALPTVSVMPLGASITEGYNAYTGTNTTYVGGGYRTKLYADMAADGRFGVDFVGSSTVLDNSRNSPAANNPMYAAGQNHHEGHYGYTTAQISNNLDGNDGSSGNDGGHWLTAGNGVNPDYIVLNVGGNDFAANSADAKVNALGRLDRLITKLATLRPNATIVVSSVTYRTDVGSSVDTYYNPYLPALVYSHVAAGQHVQFLDFRNTIDSSSLTDGTHPNKAGYDKMADAAYQAVTNGAAYWTGNQGGTWATLGAAGASNWATNWQRTIDRLSVPNYAAAATPDKGVAPDVYFETSAGATTLGQDLSIRGLNFTAGATGGVSINGTNTLTLGVGGVTVQAGTGVHAINAAVTLGAAQTWTNVSSSAFTVNGNVGGVAALALAGTGRFIFNGTNGLGGMTAVGPGTTLAGVGNFAGPVSVQAGGTLSPGSAGGALGTGNLTLAGGATLALTLNTPTPLVGYDRVNVTGTVDVTGATLGLTPGGTPAPGTTFLVVDNDGSDAVVGRFANVTTIDGVDYVAANGTTFRIDYAGGTGNDITLTAVPEPAGLTLSMIAGVAILRRRHWSVSRSRSTGRRQAGGAGLANGRTSSA